VVDQRVLPDQLDVDWVGSGGAEGGREQE
jgi:hypothetical protein